jgi:hypothetical protein
VLSVVALVLAICAVYATQPLFGVKPGAPKGRVDPQRLRAHVETLCTEFAPRTPTPRGRLDQAAEWVRARLAEAGATVSTETFDVDGREFVNVVARVGPEAGERIVVGAHYDAADAGIGADDNASGVAALIELARVLATAAPPLRVDLVAFALEEPPYYRTDSMGSCVHARRLRESGAVVRAMVCLEMIGFFTDAPRSQRFPVPGLGLLYPTTGSFITVVGCLGQAGLVRRVKRAMAEATPLPVRSINAPRAVAGVDFSDHLNFWDAGFDAVMVTDTAFYRNHNYHLASDTPDTLDYERMARVVEGVHAAIETLAR